MLLAEALSERADMQKRIDQLENRLLLNAKVQEGEDPAEEPDALLCELSRLCGGLEELITRINLTNAQAQDEGQSLTALLARRDVLSRRVSLMREFLSAASSTVMRGGASEIKIRSTVPVAELQKDVDDMSRRLRELDTRIQRLNWTIALL